MIDLPNFNATVDEWEKFADDMRALIERGENVVVAQMNLDIALANIQQFKGVK